MNKKLGKHVLAAFAALFTLLASAAAHAQSADAVKADQNKWFALAAALGIGVAAALEGIARNPSASDKLFTPMILGLALIESLVIYALLIAFLLYGKIG